MIVFPSIWVTANDVEIVIEHNPARALHKESAFTHHAETTTDYTHPMYMYASIPERNETIEDVFL